MYYLTVHMINKITAEAKDVLMRDYYPSKWFPSEKLDCVDLFVYICYHEK